MRDPVAWVRALLAPVLMLAAVACGFVSDALGSTTEAWIPLLLAVPLGAASVITFLIARPVTTGSQGAVIRDFLNGRVVVPSRSPVSDGLVDLVPVVYDRGGVPMLATFASPEGAQQVAHIAPFVVSVTGADLVAGIAPGLGIVVDPGQPQPLELMPGVVRRMRADIDLR